MNINRRFWWLLLALLPVGEHNFFAGFYSGMFNSVGSYNAFVGNRSGRINSTGQQNTFVGYGSGYASQTGSFNAFVGDSAGLANSSGSCNLAFGFKAGPTTGNLTNAGAIGYNAQVGQSNSLVLGGTGTATPRGRLDVAGSGNSYLVSDPANGNSQNLFLPGSLYLAPFGGTTLVAFVQARVPNPSATTNLGLTLRTTSAGALVNALTLAASGSATFSGDVTARGNTANGNATVGGTVTVSGTVTAASFTTASDQRLKQQVRPLTGALAAVQQLHGVRYRYRPNVPGKPLPAGEQVGLLAQEVEQIYPELVHPDEAGYKSVNYAQLAPVLLEALKEQQAQIEQLQTRVSSLQADHAALETLQAQVARLRSPDAPTVRR